MFVYQLPRSYLQCLWEFVEDVEEIFSIEWQGLVWGECSLVVPHPYCLETYWLFREINKSGG